MIFQVEKNVNFLLACIHLYIFMCVHMHRSHSCVYRHTFTCVQVHIHVCAGTLSHVGRHTFTCVQIHIHMHADTLHLCACACGAQCSMGIFFKCSNALCLIDRSLTEPAVYWFRSPHSQQISGTLPVPTCVARGRVVYAAIVGVWC